MRRAARGAGAAAGRLGRARSTRRPTRFAAHRRASTAPTRSASTSRGQLLTEDYYVFNKLAKGLIGTNNVDTNSRLCMSSAVAGYKATLGADAPPACYDDIGPWRRRIFIAGSNTAWAHPILFRRIEDARRANPALKIDRRRPAPHRDRRSSPTCTCRSCPAPTSCCSTACCTCMLWEGLADTAYIAAHTSGFDALRDRVREFTPAHGGAGLRRLKADDIVQAARWFGRARTRAPRCRCTARA